MPQPVPVPEQGSSTCDTNKMEEKEDIAVKIKTEEEKESATKVGSSNSGSGLRFKDFASEKNLASNVNKQRRRRNKGRMNKQINNGRYKRLRRPRGPAALSTVQMWGVSLELKACSGSILFRTETVAPLLKNSLPTKLSAGELKSAMTAASHPSRNKSSKLREYVSWKALRLYINGSLHDQALKFAFSQQMPFLEKRRHSTELDANEQAGAATLEKDHIRVAGVDIAFVVSKGKVFFDIMGAFSALGELRIAMRGRWEPVDSILQRAGVSPKEAFRRCHKSTAGRPKAFSGQRSHVSLQALLAIVNAPRDEIPSNFLQDDNRRQSFSRLFSYLKKEAEAVEEKKRALHKGLQCAVEGTLVERARVVVSQPKVEGEKCVKKKDAVSNSGSGGTEPCGGSCGRQYHFIKRCCDQDHVLDVGGGRTVGYVVREDRLFLEKCSAFSALGRKYVIRCSDYRKADKVLAESGMPVRSHYLYEDRESYSESGGGVAAAAVRNRRTHLSWEAFAALVRSGFADSTRRENILKALAEAAAAMPRLKGACHNHSKVGQVAPAENGLEKSTECSGDVNSSEQEDKVDMIMKLGSPKSENEGISGGGDDIPQVEVMGRMVPFHIARDVVFLEKRTVFEACGSDVGRRNFRTVDKLLEKANMCLDDAFLYERRRRGYISTGALRALAGQDFFPVQCKSRLLPRLSAIEEEKEALRTNRVVSLPQGSVNFKVHHGTVYLNTMQILCAVGFSAQYLGSSRSKVYFVICRLLRVRGLNQAACFLRQGKSKYVFMSMEALQCLFQTDFGPFKDKQRVESVRKELVTALAKQDVRVDGINLQGDRKDAKLPGQSHLYIGKDFSPVPYKKKKGSLFLHRKTCFEALGLEKEIMTCPRGFGPVNDILKRNDISLKKAYLPSKSEDFAYMSLTALITVLESQDSLVICLEKRDKFSDSVLGALEAGAAKGLLEKSGHIQVNDRGIAYRSNSDGRLFYDRNACYQLSGLYDKQKNLVRGDYDIFRDPATPLSDRGLDATKYFIGDGGDSFAFISLAALLIIMSLDGEVSRPANFNKLLWKNLLAAVTIEAPRLETHLRMSAFRANLLDALVGQLLASLDDSREGNAMADAENFVKISELQEEDGEPTATKKQRLSTASLNRSASESSSVDDATLRALQIGTVEEVPSDEQEYLESLLRPRNSSSDSLCSSPGSHDESSSLEGDSGDEFKHCVTSEVFNALRTSLEDCCQQGLMTGDWKVTHVEQDEIRLLVEPGSAVTRKMSFIHSDVFALLKYDLCLRPLAHPEFRINNLIVPASLVLPIVEKSSKKGILNLLYHLLTMRPCFGNFNPELVETVARGAEAVHGVADVFLDRTFVGSSQTGRTFAGTVRSRRCRVVASIRVADTCSECDKLRQLVVNRSVLSSETHERSESDDSGVGGSLSQESVWKVEEGSAEGCVFACPQLQFFNASLPNAFRKDGQARMVVEHRVSIAGADLKAEVSINGREVKKALGCHYEKDKQVGPLLEWAASLRMCVGYPDRNFVQQARYHHADMKSAVM